MKNIDVSTWLAHFTQSALIIWNRKTQRSLIRCYGTFIAVIWHRRVSAPYLLSSSYDHSFLLYQVLSLGLWYRNYFDVINYHIFTFQLWMFQWNIYIWNVLHTFINKSIQATPTYTPFRHTNINATHERCFLTDIYVMLNTYPHTVQCGNMMFWYSKPFVMYDFIQIIRKTSQVRWKFNIDIRLIIQKCKYKK